MIETLFPDPVVTLEATPGMWSAALLPEEEACLSPRAVAKRRREFAAGRSCARAALARLGIRDFPLLSESDRTPRWPVGIVGSLSHCGDYCGVAVARRGPIAGIGLDVERARPLHERVARMIGTPGELERLALLPDLPQGLWAMVVFCAKESTYKCFYPLARMYLDFHDVEIDLEPAAGSFTARVLKARGAEGGAADPPVRALRGRFAWDDAHVFAGVTLTADELGAGPSIRPGRAHGACGSQTRSEKESDAGPSPTTSDAVCGRNPHAPFGFRRRGAVCFVAAPRRCSGIGLRRGASHPAPRRPERDPAQYSDRLLGPSPGAGRARSGSGAARPGSRTGS